MSIELAPKEYQISCSYEEAVLYCFQLDINGKTGWRLPTNDDAMRYNLVTWYLNDDERDLYETFNTIPVRDIISNKIELAPNKYWIGCYYDEARIYCFQLEIDGKQGWRLPTLEESMQSIRTKYLHWYLNDDGRFDNSRYMCIPVRDII